MNNLTLEDINSQIEEYENKIIELKQKKVEYNFIKYFGIKSNIEKQLKNLKVEADYEYNDHCHDEYGHDAEANLNVTFGDGEYLKINYIEAQGAGTECRYSPTIDCDISITKKAKKLLFKNLDEIDVDDYEHDEAYQQFRDIIENIVTN
tara:strand:- start:104 stop:550 length:447 start_codon:yes stop_codon:yes gene_type:complete